MLLHSSNEPGELSQWLCHDDSTINIVVLIIIIIIILDLFLVRLLSVQCYAWTEYKFTCVCVSVTFSVNLPTGQTPQRIFTVDSLKDADLRKDVPFRGLDDE